AGPGDRRGRCDRARHRAAPALGNELVRRAHRSAAGAGAAMSTRGRLAVRVTAGALLACTAACATPPTGKASTPTEATAMAPERSGRMPARPAPPRVQPGEEVAGSRIGIPPAMRAGSQITVQV